MVIRRSAITSVKTILTRCSALLCLAGTTTGCKNEDPPQTIQQTPARPVTSAPGAGTMSILPHETVDSAPVSNKTADYPDAATSPYFQTHPTALEVDLLAKMRAVNNQLDALDVVSVMPWRPQYLILVKAQAAEKKYPDRLTNVGHASDLFGLFVVNHELSRAHRRLGLFVSPHPDHYKASLLAATRDSIIICGEDAEKGDDRRRWAFAISPADSATLRFQDSLATATPPRPPHGRGMGDDAEDVPDDYIAPQCPLSNTIAK